MRGLEQIPWLYDAAMAWMEKGGLGRWRDHLIGAARGRTLEVGCGTGRNLPRYAASHEVVACEPDLRVVVAARRRAGSVALVVADVQALPFKSDAFESVVSSLVFCSVPDPERGLAEIHRVLRRDGVLAMLEHVRHPFGPVGLVQDLVQPIWTWAAGGCRPNRDTEATVASCGFEIDGASRRARGVMRLYTARPVADWTPPRRVSAPLPVEDPWEGVDPADLEIEMEVGDVLDLHSFPPKQVKDLVRDYLDHAVEQGWPQVRIIHGKGVGVQRRTVRALLDKDPRVVEYGDPPGEHGGWGATWVRLQRPPGPPS